MPNYVSHFWSKGERDMKIICYLAIRISKNQGMFVWALHIQLCDKGFIDRQIPVVTSPWYFTSKTDSLCQEKDKWVGHLSLFKAVYLI